MRRVNPLSRACFGSAIHSDTISIEGSHPGLMSKAELDIQCSDLEDFRNYENKINDRIIRKEKKMISKARA
jgi:hypothetical protein